MTLTEYMVINYFGQVNNRKNFNTALGADTAIRQVKGELAGSYLIHNVDYETDNVAVKCTFYWVIYPYQCGCLTLVIKLAQIYL